MKKFHTYLILLQGAATIRLNKRGIYQVLVNGSAATSAAAGNITIQLRKNGILQPQALSIASSTANTDVVSLSFDTLVQVTENNCNCPCSTPTVIEIVNTGVDSDFSLIKIDVVRV